MKSLIRGRTFLKTYRVKRQLNKLQSILTANNLSFRDISLKSYIPDYLLEQLADKEANKLVNEYEQHFAVYAAVRFISSNISRVQFDLQGRGAEANEWSRLFLSPNVYQSRTQFFEYLISNLELRGGAYVVYLSDKPDGQLALTEVPKYMFVARTDEIKMIKRGSRITGYEIDIQDLKRKINPWQVERFYFVNPLSILGEVAPLSPAKLYVKEDFSANVYNYQFFRNGAFPGGILETEDDITDDEASMLRGQFEDDHRGPTKAYNLAVLPANMKFKPIEIPHKEALFMETRKMNRDDILATFGIDPALISSDEMVAYGTYKGIIKKCWQTTLFPIMMMVSDTFNSKTLARYGVEMVWNLSSIEELQDVLKDKLEWFEKLAKHYPINVVNEFLQMDYQNRRLPSVPYGDTFFMPANMVPVDMILSGEIINGNNNDTSNNQNTEPEPEKDEKEKRAGRVMVARKKIVLPAVPKIVLSLAEKKSLHAVVQHGPRTKGFDVRAYHSSLARVTKLLTEKYKWFFDRINKQELAAVIDLLYFYRSMPGIIPGEVEEIFNQSLDRYVEYEEKFNLHIFGVMQEVVLKEAQAIESKNFEGQMVTGELTPKLAEFIRKKKTLIKTIEKKFHKGVLETITLGMANKMTQDEIADVLRFKYGEWRLGHSATIAQTEVHQAVGAGRHEQYGKLGGEEHAWLTCGDAGVRSTHSMCEDQGYIPIGEAFVNGCLYPGDPAGSAREVVNCRCFEQVEFVTKRKPIVPRVSQVPNPGHVYNSSKIRTNRIAEHVKQLNEFKLTPAERESMDRYVGSLYSPMNKDLSGTITKYLRGGDWQSALNRFAITEEEFKQVVATLQKTLSKLPKFETRVWRGFPMPESNPLIQNLLNVAGTDTPVTLRGFTSSTVKHDIADAFASAGPDEMRIILRIKGKNGILLKKVAGEEIGIPWEHEVLFNDNMQIIVESVERKADELVFHMAEVSN